MAINSLPNTSLFWFCFLKDATMPRVTERIKEFYEMRNSCRPIRNKKKEVTHVPSRNTGNLKSIIFF